MTTATFSNANGTTTKFFAGQLFTLKADDFGGIFWDNGKGGLHPATLADQVALEALMPEGWYKRTTDLTEAEKREFIVKDNVSFGD